MNGTVSRYEIIGDHMGIRAAFRAFKKAQKRETVKLPGFDDATGEQMFFYNYAFVSFFLTYSNPQLSFSETMRRVRPELPP